MAEIPIDFYTNGADDPIQLYDNPADTAINLYNSTQVIKKTVAEDVGVGDFTSIIAALAWFVANYPSFVTADICGEIEIIGEWDNPAGGDNDVNLIGFDVDRFHFLTIYTSGDARHDGRAASVSGRKNYRMVIDDYDGAAFYVARAWTVIDGIEIYATKATGKNAIACSSTTSAIVKNCVIHDISTTGIYLSSDYCEAYNNIVYKCLNKGIHATRYYHFIANNTVCWCGTNIQLDNTIAPSTLWNNIAQGGTTADYNIASAGNDMQNNICSDGTSPNPAFQNKNVVFVNETAGSEDLHLDSSDTEAADNAVTITSNFTDDIDGDTRPSGSWDIGADERI